MGIFDDGGCDNDGCNNGKALYPEYHYDRNTKKDEWTEVERECSNCLGTKLELTSMGRELVEFLREIKGKI